MSAMEKIQHKREAGGYSEGLVGLRKELGFYSEYNGNSQVAVIKNPPAMQKMQIQSLGQEDPLEKEMATHPSILAWEIPWTEELGGLQSTGSQKNQTWLSN